MYPTENRSVSLQWRFGNSDHSRFESSEVANLFHKDLEWRIMSSIREKKRNDENFVLENSIRLCRRDRQWYFLSFKELGANFLGSDRGQFRKLNRQSSEKQNAFETLVPVKKTILSWNQRLERGHHRKGILFFKGLTGSANDRWTQGRAGDCWL